MPAPRQTEKQLDDVYDKWKLYRELEILHERVNELLVSADQEDASETLKVNYVAGDLGSAATIATAINATNTRVNELAEIINVILEKIRADDQ